MDGYRGGTGSYKGFQKLHGVTEVYRGFGVAWRVIEDYNNFGREQDYRRLMGLWKVTEVPWGFRGL